MTKGYNWTHNNVITVYHCHQLTPLKLTKTYLSIMQLPEKRQHVFSNVLCKTIAISTCQAQCITHDSFSYRWAGRPYCLVQVSDPLQPVKTKLLWCRLKVPLFPPSLSDLDVHVHWRGYELHEQECVLGGPVGFAVHSGCEQVPFAQFTWGVHPCRVWRFCSVGQEETREVDPTQGRERELQRRRGGGELNTKRQGGRAQMSRRV